MDGSAERSTARLSSRRSRESSSFKYLWTPAFAGVIRLSIFHETVILNCYSFNKYGIYNTYLEVFVKIFYGCRL